ncbi:G2-specific serine/threonine protein kinase [Exophiala xenobiotica]|nr:G2-specific serine/threonine protein kinase [Exophiala xenobiotica]
MIHELLKSPCTNSSASLALDQILNGSAGYGPSGSSSTTVPSDPTTRYVDLGKQYTLGSGRYGHVGMVKAVRDGKSTEEIYACKTLLYVKDEDKEKIGREIKLLKSLRHPNIVEYVDFYIVDDTGEYNPNGNRARLVMECCDGDLVAYLEKSTKAQNEMNQYTRSLTTKPSVENSTEEDRRVEDEPVRNSTRSATGLPQPIIWRCLDHIASALFLCHYRTELPPDRQKPKVSPERVIHRDVKPPNILTKLATGRPDEEIIFKLADFGISVEKKNAHTTFVGNFCAPGQDPNEHDEDEEEGEDDGDDVENYNEEGPGDDDDEIGFYWTTEKKRRLLASEPNSAAYGTQLRELMADCVALKPSKRPSIWEVWQTIQPNLNK